MATASPLPAETEIPASRIMRERDEHKAAWAREYTRAEQLDRELSSALRRAADWEAIALENGERAAQLNVTLARMQRAADEGIDAQTIDRLNRESADLHRQIKRLSGDLATYRDALSSIANTVYEYHRPASDRLDSIEREIQEMIDDDALFEDCGPEGCLHWPSDSCGGLRRVPR